MSSNLSTMPGCAGYSGSPVEDWVLLGKTCMDCALYKICKEYFEEHMQVLKDLPIKEIEILSENER